ncbi:LOW QUALITY PROTEIN: pancreatic progenitor cell differentiation and proliferation factor-like [Lutra lutra]|uniref:LOW QUALITY PROTEIN: pancreatic progenitor cell differentiation and proliferation factor-like n=1 Tax=Lutra lutra TaxID=9657 RepID=UPI001FD12CA0|nr:LOW QUALITY PROTEIN: pancreatic progenitor cell differentiation and proliferation factor-like [Lutra lutra]
MATIPSSSLLVATQDYYWHRLGSTSSNSSFEVQSMVGKSLLTTRVSPRPTWVTGMHAAASGSPLSHSWLQCWSPQNAQNLARPPAAQSPATWLWKP